MAEIISGGSLETMPQPTSISVDADTETLRAELKAWEKAFAETHEGRKPGRSDIKAAPEIAQKYKAYNRASGRAVPAPRAPATSTPKAKRKHSMVDFEKENTTPRKSPRRSHASPETWTHATPIAQRTFVGPTPQKNGQILGLFDLLSPASSRKEAATPSRHTKKRVERTPSGRQTLTPAKSRPASSQPASDDMGGAMAALFRTPTAARTGAPLASTTPESASRTPAVLRRDAVSLFSRPATRTGDEAEGDITSFSPVPMRRLPPRPAGRSFSQILRGLREMEEEYLDDELDALREMEAEEAGIVLPKPLPKPQVVMPEEEAEWSLGPDGVAVDEEGQELPEIEEEDGEGATTKRRWKKKGQKRTTRNVAIGVSEKRWAPEPEWKPGEKGEAEQKNKGRSISAAAHANFRALKIKNKNSKAKRGGGRFGRR